MLPVVCSDTVQKLLSEQKDILSEKKDILERYYREPTYFYINFVLRNGRMPMAEETNRRETMSESKVLSEINEMDSIFRSIKPLSVPIIVYRGIPLDNARSHSAGSQFYSTSFDYKTAVSFLNSRLCCVLKITVPAGAKVIITNNDMKEVILNRNLNIRVTNPDYKLPNLRYFTYDAIAIDTGKTVSLETFINNTKMKEQKLRKEMETEMKKNQTPLNKTLQDLADLIELDDVDPDTTEEIAEKLNLSVKQTMQIAGQVQKIVEESSDPDSVDILQLITDMYEKVR